MLMRVLLKMKGKESSLATGDYWTGFPEVFNIANLKVLETLMKLLICAFTIKNTQRFKFLNTCNYYHFMNIFLAYD